MTKSMRVKHFVAPALLTLAALGLGSGCSSAKNALGGDSCGKGDSGLNVSMHAMSTAVADLQALEADVTGSVALACASIAKDLGSATADPTKFKAGTKASSDDINTACNDAKAQLNTALTAAGSGAVTVSVIAPSCEVDVSAQLDCQANCNAEVNCTAPDVTAQCDPGHLSGSCDATCTGSCTVTGTAAASCTGTCEGTCSGNCTGQAASGTGTATTANGQCNGTCDGTCQGSCKATASATAKCDGSCSGSCSVAIKAPSCDVALTPPKCDAAANCNAGCDGSASAKMVCTKPSVSVTVTGTASASLKTTLETNLPLLVQVAAKGKVAATSIAAIATTAVDVGGQLTAQGAACLSAAASFAGQVTAAASSSVNVSASFSASASVSGSAGAG